ncbi:MAG: aminoacyl-tRNA hydrolase [Oscillospiraceae bacterium]
MFFSNKIDYVIVGLGNKGLKYDGTRHNVGFDTIDYISKENDIIINKMKFDGLYNIINFEGKKVLFIKPLTYMNLSGQCIKKVCDYYKIDSKKVVVIQDDIALPVGKLRIKRKGSHGGQNGIRNIIDTLMTDEFIRVKIGVGEKPNKDYDLSDWVLSKFSKEEQKKINDTFKYTLTIIKYIINDDIDKAMELFN